jgi:hypothetical protein
LSEDLRALADAVSDLERRVSDVILASVRDQLHEERPDEARELERRLTKVRRSLHKAETLLRGVDGD